jgi:tetratricopeptide (TPR) repeat protein
LDKISDSIVQKAQIVSNLNRETNLFLRLAARNYEVGNYDESAQILEKQLEQFPKNSAAQILLSKAYARLGKYHQAVQQLKSACEAIHSPKTFDFYLKEIEAIQRGEKIDFTNFEQKSPKPIILAESSNKGFAKNNEIKPTEHSLVSETLAKIYISQGEIKEAISIYEKLIERKPENKEKYLHAIEELKSRLEK